MMIPSVRVAGLQRPWRLVVDGDSNTATASSSWWATLGTLLTGYPAQTVGNFAVQGHTWANALNKQSAVNAAAVDGMLNCIVLMYGTNDINSGRTAAQAIESCDTYLTGVSSKYARRVLMQIPALSSDGAKNAQVSLYNMDLLSRGSACLRRPVLLDDSTNTLYYNVDATHLNTDGWNLLAAATKQGLETIL